MADKRASIDEVISSLSSGMTLGIGGWGSRRKPMAIIRALCRSAIDDLTVVAFGGPDIGLLCATGKVRRLITGFVTLDSIPTDANYRRARQGGQIELAEFDEGMVFAGLQAASWRVPYLPVRAGVGSDVVGVSPWLKTVTTPYESAPFGPNDDHDTELIAMPALYLDAAIVHANRADTAGNAQLLGPDPYFDELFLGAAALRIVTTEKVVAPGELQHEGPLSAVTINRLMTDMVVATPNGAHFTSCTPDYERDEAFQKSYVSASADAESFAAFRSTYLDVGEDEYQRLVAP